jgi:hypothetical protein
MSEAFERNFRQYQLTRRLLLHGARTRTICNFTGLSPHTVSTWRRQWAIDDKSRRRGPSPNSVTVIFRSPALRSEASCLTIVFDAMRPSSWARKLPYTLESGEILCSMLESYQCLHPDSRFCFEQFLLLVKALLGGLTIKRSECSSCGAAIVIDALSTSGRLCARCNRRGTAARVDEAFSIGFPSSATALSV